MAELYWGTTSEFVTLARGNVLVRRLVDAWFDAHGSNPTEAEQRSWRNSLAKLAMAITTAGLDDHGILVEYQVPLTSMRIDAVLTGTNPDDRRPAAVIVELKQWDGNDISSSTVDECVTAGFYGHSDRVLHPSAQAKQYRAYLTDVHTAFHEEHVRLHACAYLHDFLDDPSHELLSARHANSLAVAPLFPGDRIDELALFLDDRIGQGDGLSVLRTIRDGRYRPSRKLLQHTADMIESEDRFTLLDEQQVVFKSILARVADVADTDLRSVFVIRGGPGTGKSVLAMQLVAELARAGYSVNHATGSAAFTNTVRKLVGTKASSLFTFFNSYLNADPDILDVLVCDEAHRIRKHSWNRWTKKKAEDPDRPQIAELLHAARVGVFFIDDLQAVRKNEIGNSTDIEEQAEVMGADVHEFRLEAQFRCGGSDGFVRWVENTLGIARTANPLWSGDPAFEFRLVDSVEELEATVLARNENGETARLVAGYCWPWSDPVGEEVRTLVPDVQIGDWARPWNARPDATRLAPGIPKSHLWATEPGGIDQVGCVYTAQGFEFDHVGVIMGPDLVYRGRNEGWLGRKEFSHDSGAKRGVSPERFSQLVKNTYRVLLTRGMKSCSLLVLDDQTRGFIESRLDHFQMREFAAETPGDFRP